jgi:outer membrane lipase/esterase
MRPRAITTALALFTAALAPAMAGGFDQYIGLGDSNLDSGYFRYHLTGIPAIDQANVAALAAGNSLGFAGPGVMNSTMLAARFGLTALPVGSPSGGTNYAVGGAQSAVVNGPLLSTVQQIQNYLVSVNGAANPNALYVINTGDNDLTPVLSNGATWNAANPNYLSDQATALAQQVAVLQGAGARTIMVSNMFRYAVLAGPGGDLPSINAAQYALSVAHAEDIWSKMTAAGVAFVPIDKDSLFQFVVKHPTFFGFTANSVLSASAPCTVVALDCTTITAAQLQNTLFVDGKHMTTAGQQIQADYEYSLLAGPNQMSLLGEANVQTGLSRIAAVQGEVERRGPAEWNLWIGGGAGDLSIENVTGMANLSSTPWRGTIGADYRFADGVILGAAFTLGGQTASFSTGGGFVQTDETIDLYAGYAGRRLWGNALVSFGALHADTTRIVPVGIYTDENRGKASGEAYALALSGGANFEIAGVTTGPVAGLVLQRIHFGNFTETGVSGTTALAYAGQRRDSAITQLGWKAAFDWGILHPFAEVQWQHEWAGRNRRVTASITTASAPPYSVDAAPIAANWAAASAGAAYQITPRLTLTGTFTALVGNPVVDNYGGDLRLAMAL